MVLAPISRPRRVFSHGLFAVLLVSLGLIGSGCALTPPPLLSPPPFGSAEDRQTLADNSVSFAVTALDSAGNGGDHKAADEAIRDAVRFLGEGSDAYVAVGRQLIERNHPAEAVRLLSEATQNKGNAQDAALWATLATAYEKAGNAAGTAQAKARAEQEAEAVMATIGKNQPMSANDVAGAEVVVRFVQTGTYYSDIKNDIPHAKAALREARRLAPDNPFVLNALGYLLADKGTTKAEFDEAVRLTHEAVDSDLVPPTADVLNSYGWALFKTGDLPGARRVLRSAVDLGPDSAECRYHLGVVYGQMGLIDDARRELDRATTIQKGYEEAEQAKKQLKQPPGKGVTEGA